MMKTRFLLVSIALCVVIFYSCDDAGTEKTWVPRGQITFSHSNLKTLNPALDSSYVLWLGLGPAVGRIWYDLGHFNISAAGEVVDSMGTTKTFVFTGDTNTLGDATVAVVTIGYNPERKVLLSTNLNITSDSISGTMKISGDLALGNFGKSMLGEPPYSQRASGSEVLASPTTNNANCRQGVWLSDSLGNTSFSDGLSLTPGKGWIVQAWVHDASINEYYPIGRFYNFYGADNDGPGLCAGPGAGFNRPGQDFIQSGGGCPPITNIGNGTTGVIITLEPENESSTGLSTPFYLKLFWRGVFSPSVICNYNYPYLANQYLTIPWGSIHITY